MNVTRKSVALACTLSLILIALCYAVMHKTFTVHCRGQVKGIGVGVFWDPDATQPVEYVDWGMIEPGENVSEVLYFKSQSNVNITLSMATENWAPPNAAEYMSLAWNYSGQPLTPKTVTPVELQLHVYGNITDVTEFSFDIIITGSG